MKQRLAKKSTQYNILICAHPDDETLFFGGLIQKERNSPWIVVCATDGNADGMGFKRKKDFEAACKKLGAKKTLMLGFSDVYTQRLDISALHKCFAELPAAKAIYTHGPVGEYGHPHHQDVSWAVHSYYQGHKNIWGTAYNCYPDKTIILSSQHYLKKSFILSSIYGSETQRFQNILPCTSAEGFCQFQLKEVEALYNYYSQKKWPSPNKLNKFKWLIPFLEIHKNEPSGPRLF